MLKLFLYPLLFTLIACSSAEDSERNLLRKGNRTGSGVFRANDERVLKPTKLSFIEPPKYPWRKSKQVITKEHFRCKGSVLNPSFTLGDRTIKDCHGGYQHSLPLQNGKEFIYPVLVDTLNYIQEKTGKKITIISGHRCPMHNEYIDTSSYNASSKHTIGAEVAFYVQDPDLPSEEIVTIIIDKYKDDIEGKAYQEFSRYIKPDTNVSTQPWFNKEIFIKIFNKTEGRNKETSENLPYISIQVRYNREENKNVSYSWDLANQNYYRW